ncbi:MAG TPA: class D sortase [Thermoanaerobaculia bacterium]|nr:class D sortase [Thermoanaerobaculia bacterium]
MATLHKRLGGRPVRRWLEAILLLVGVVCLGVYLYAYLDARLFQAVAGRQFDRRLAQRPAAALPGEHGSAPAPTAPALQQAAEGSPIGRLEIPRIGVSVLVVEGVADASLRVAVGHIPSTGLPGAPGAPGNVGIAGHRDTFFRPLKDIRKNDQLILRTPSGTYSYRVDSIQVVPPDRVDVLQPLDHSVLTLVTCYPFYYIGSAPDRFIVQARLETT